MSNRIKREHGADSPKRPNDKTTKQPNDKTTKRPNDKTMATIYKIGNSGPVVKQIQGALNLVQDGIFGPLTRETLMTWQKEHNLKASGIAGPATLALLLPTMAANALGLKKSKRTITDIVVHCTATREGQTMTVDQIRASHKRQGWSDIGYHYVIGLNGERWNGRDVDLIGAHVSGHNTHSIGIAYVGGLENKPGVAYAALKAKDTRTDKQKAALMSLLMDLRKLYPKAKISGHRDFSPDKNHDGVISENEFIKWCPSFDAKKEYSKI